MESGTHGKGGRKLPSSLGDGSLLHQVGADRAGYMRGLGLTQVVYAATRGIASTDFPAMYWERPKDHQKTAVNYPRRRRSSPLTERGIRAENIRERVGNLWHEKE